jgi:molybdate transport system permease protein
LEGFTFVFSFAGVMLTSLLAGLGLAVVSLLGEVGITLMFGGDIANRTETLSLAICNAVLNGDFGRAERLPRCCSSPGAGGESYASG